MTGNAMASSGRGGRVRRGYEAARKLGEFGGYKGRQIHGFQGYDYHRRQLQHGRFP